MGEGTDLGDLGTPPFHDFFDPPRPSNLELMFDTWAAHSGQEECVLMSQVTKDEVNPFRPTTGPSSRLRHPGPPARGDRARLTSPSGGSRHRSLPPSGMAPATRSRDAHHPSFVPVAQVPSMCDRPWPATADTYNLSNCRMPLKGTGADRVRQERERVPRAPHGGTHRALSNHRHRVVAAGATGPAPRGRPSKLTPALLTRLLALVRDGVPIDVAVAAVGVHRATFFSWAKRGREASAKAKGGEALDAEERRYAAFAEDLEEARAQAEATAVGVVRTAMSSSWQAATWYLERAHPQRWGRRRAEPETPPQPAVDSGDTIVQLAEQLKRLEPDARARLVWEATVAAGTSADIGEELAEGARLRRNAEQRLALEAGEPSEAESGGEEEGLA